MLPSTITSRWDQVRCINWPSPGSMFLPPTSLTLWLYIVGHPSPPRTETTMHMKETIVPFSTWGLGGIQPATLWTWTGTTTTEEICPIMAHTMLRGSFGGMRKKWLSKITTSPGQKLRWKWERYFRLKCSLRFWPHLTAILFDENTVCM